MRPASKTRTALREANNDSRIYSSINRVRREGSPQYNVLATEVFGCRLQETETPIGKVGSARTKDFMYQVYLVWPLPILIAYGEIEV